MKAIPRKARSFAWGWWSTMPASVRKNRAAYKPTPGKVVAFDLGMATLLATSEGDLLGRGWQARLERLDSLLQGIA